MYRYCCAFLVVLGLAACGKTPSGETGAPAESADEAARFRNVGTDVAFVGDAACFDCHEDIYRGYAEHGMARSMYRLTSENTVEDFSGVVVRHPESGFFYRPYREGDRFFQEEYRLGADGRPTHRLVREIAYVVGSGTAARTYLAEQDGRLHEMPLTWYTQVGHWDFSPGYRERNSRFDRLVNDRCMACHNSYPETVPFAEGKYEEVPLGIGCERCHGPGALHVDERLAVPEPSGEVDETIVNPAHLSLDRRLDVCQQCHLQTAVSILREDRGPFDFRPSQALASFVSLFARDAPDRDDVIGVISHADRMKRSACFIETQASAAAMDCTTCHNPHEGFRSMGEAYFNQTCVDCHGADALAARFEAPEVRANHTASADCISCHMPKVETEDAPHASFTDHFIRVVEEQNAPRPAAALPAHEPVKLVPYFEADREGAAARRYEGIAYVAYGKQQGDSLAFERGIDLLAEALSDDPEHGEAQYLLGFARLQLGRVEEAIPALEASVRLDAGIPERLNALAQAYEAGRRDAERIERLYQRALSLQPALADVRLNYGRFLESRGRLDDAVAQYRLAVEERPWLETAHYNLGTALLRAGEMEAGEAALREAVALQPDYPEALGNLGLLHASRGDLAQARTYFERAVEANPSHPVALGNLGAYYLNADDLPRAIELLERAVAADPAYVDGLVNLALAHFRNEAYPAARYYAEQALRHDPQNARARQILSSVE